LGRNSASVEREKKLERRLRFYSLRFMFILIPVIALLLVVIILSLI